LCAHFHRLRLELRKARVNLHGGVAGLLVFILSVRLHLRGRPLFIFSGKPGLTAKRVCGRDSLCDLPRQPSMARRVHQT
jgi:hypothetical protein